MIQGGLVSSGYVDPLTHMSCYLAAVSGRGVWDRRTWLLAVLPSSMPATALASYTRNPPSSSFLAAPDCA